MMVDTLIYGFFSQMNDIDVILKSALGSALIEAVFMRTEVDRFRLRFPAPLLVELEILVAEILATFFV